MWSDNETELDAINVQHVVAAILDILTSPHLTPITVGVFGPWGIGKSSVAKMIQRVLTPAEGHEKDSDTLVVYFNGWRFEGYEDAKAALAAVILESLEQRAKLMPSVWEKSKSSFQDLWARVKWLRVGKTVLAAGLAVKTGGLSVLLTRGAGLLAGKGAEASDDQVTSDETADNAWFEDRADQERSVHSTIRDFDKAFKRLLELTAVNRLVVVIDDLDRCLPDRVIDTLEAIRLFLSVEGSAFVITADEVLVQHAVRARFPGMESLRAQVGQDYLEKMIQIPVRLPLLGRADLENYLNLLFAQRRLTKEQFTELCHRIIAPITVGAPSAALDDGSKGQNTTSTTPGVDVPFGLDTAEGLLGALYGQGLRSDLAMAKQIAHVVGMSVAGNPRQIKRYLNALVLRLSIASKRGVFIDPPLAAKLMLLEYFRTEAFLQLARWQAVQRGRPQELAALEQARVGERSHGARQGGGAVRTSAVERGLATSSSPIKPPSSRRGKATAGSESIAEGGGGDAGVSTAAPRVPGLDTDAAADGVGDPVVGLVVGPEASAWLQEEWLLAWLDTTPSLAGTDLGPYFYFARDRLVAQAVSTQQLGPLGEAVFAGLSEVSRAAHLSVEARAKSLTSPVAFAVLASLAERARLTGKPDAGDDSPYGAIYSLCGWRPELAGEVVRFFGTQPLSVFRSATPARLLAATSLSPAADAARALVQQWSHQKENARLAEAAERALR